MKSQPFKSKRPKVANIKVDWSGNHLSMEAIGEEALKLIEAEGYALVWSRDGQTRAVPRFIIEDGQIGLKDSPLFQLLPKLHGISWARAGLTQAELNSQG